MLKQSVLVIVPIAISFFCSDPLHQGMFCASMMHPRLSTSTGWISCSSVPYVYKDLSGCEVGILQKPIFSKKKIGKKSCTLTRPKIVGGKA